MTTCVRQVDSLPRVRCCVVAVSVFTACAFGLCVWCMRSVLYTCASCVISAKSTIYNFLGHNSNIYFFYHNSNYTSQFLTHTGFVQSINKNQRNPYNT